jgi:hypothetical protein
MGPYLKHGGHVSNLKKYNPKKGLATWGDFYYECTQRK